MSYLLFWVHTALKSGSFTLRIQIFYFREINLNYIVNYLFFFTFFSFRTLQIWSQSASIPFYLFISILFFLLFLYLFSIYLYCFLQSFIYCASYFAFIFVMVLLFFSFTLYVNLYFLSSYCLMISSLSS